MFEYKVIPAPRKAVRSKGAKGTAERFSATVQSTLNEMGAEGWSFLRAETLPVDERQGVMRKVVEEFHTVLIFSRPLAEKAETARGGLSAERGAADLSGPKLGAATANVDAATTPEVKAVKDDADTPAPKKTVKAEK